MRICICHVNFLRLRISCVEGFHKNVVFMYEPDIFIYHENIITFFFVFFSFYLYKYMFMYLDISQYDNNLFFFVFLPYFHIWNCALILPRTLILSTFLGIVFTLSITTFQLVRYAQGCTKLKSAWGLNFNINFRPDFQAILILSDKAQNVNFIWEIHI